MKAGSSFIFFDSNFSGVNRDKIPFIPKGGSIQTIPVFPKTAQNNFTVVYASFGEQANIFLENQKHGLFTYSLLKMLHLYGLKNYKVTAKQLFKKMASIIITESIRHKANMLPKIEGGGINNYILK